MFGELFKLKNWSLFFCGFLHLLFFIVISQTQTKASLKQKQSYIYCHIKYHHSTGILIFPFTILLSSVTLFYNIVLIIFNTTVVKEFFKRCYKIEKTRRKKNRDKHCIASHIKKRRHHIKIIKYYVGTENKIKNQARSSTNFLNTVKRSLWETPGRSDIYSTNIAYNLT